MSTAEDQIAAEMTPDEDDLEAEHDEQGDGGEQEAEQEAPEAAAPPPPTEKEIEARMRALEKQAVKHAAAVEKIMGDDFAMLVPSPVDWTPGFIFNVPGMQPLPEQVAELHALLGGSAPAELKAATDAEACPDCNAIGDVLTGSRKPGQETKPCPACGGTGWKPKLAVAPQHAQVYDYSQNAGNGLSQPNQIQVADRFGRPFGHPHYNLDPAQVGV